MSEIRCVYFMGCPVCGRYEQDSGAANVPICCGVPMYGEMFPVRPDNQAMIDAAYVKARKWARSEARRGR